MKRILTALSLVLLLSPACFADEGMWMLPLLQKMNSKQMGSLGCKVSANQIYNVSNPSLTDAVVHFGSGCTGEIISAEGLLITNHHCGYSSIQKLSTPEHNYLEEGFWAMTRKEEIPVPGLTVTFLENMTDVTDVVTKVGAKAYKKSKRNNPAEAAERAMSEYRQTLIDNAKADNPGCEASVVEFYNGNTLYLIVSKVYKDVRFVGAPPVSIGKFGGETDNWMWPRHTGDFSMFRVYAGKDNQPADFAPDNVPYTPKTFLKVSTKGYKEGSYGMIIGYPGRTQRYMTAVQLQDMLETNDIRIEARTIRQNLMQEAMRADDRVNLQYASKYASSSNGWKKWRGMKQSFAKLGIIEREKKKEADFIAWEQMNKKTKDKYDGALEKINEATEMMAPSKRAMALLYETLLNIELVGLSNAKNSSVYRDYDLTLDRKIAYALTKYYVENVLPSDVIEIPGWTISQDTYDDYLNMLYTESVFTSAEKYEAAVASGADLSKDPASILRKAIVARYKSLQNSTRDVQRNMQEASRAYSAGLMEWHKKDPSYPDANSTMRLTYGTIKGYSPKDAVIYKYYSTIKGILEKEDPDSYEFRIPDKLKVVAQNRDYDAYANADGELPVCFLLNCDITGGNSGSPVLDASGNLIGLAFDGNWEAMSSDVMFEPELQRCICVDIRYVLAVIDKIGGASFLLKEMVFAGK